jgi:ribosomal subunit interface protein
MKLESVEKPITIGSANIDLGDALRTHAEESILKAAGKYFGRLTEASAHFNREGLDYRCSVSMKMGGLQRTAAEAQAPDARLAFDQALGKVEKQLRRMKRELREDRAG